MNELIIIGKTTAPFGIKGEIKVVSDFERCNDAFIKGRTIMINNINHKITSIRYHKNKILMGIDNLDNINLILDYIGYNIYMARDELNLSNDEYLYSDLIGCKVMDRDELIGTVKNIEYGTNNDYIRVVDDKEFLIPLIPEYINNFDHNEKILYTKGAKDLKF